MTDNEIIALYWARDERAVTETADRYGRFCYAIAYNILHINEDAEECVNDTYQTAWSVIPPQRPERFRPWLGKVVRNIAFDIWDKLHAQKRFAGMDFCWTNLQNPYPRQSMSRMRPKQPSSRRSSTNGLKNRANVTECFLSFATGRASLYSQ